ncbi:glycerol-3-phosphate dehydrogenase [Pelagibius litoralis]|uniref:Glycerol-3-phosphate dehydrogenase n=1 Tax=Pelagibius litoralis TaxID=374515 RepID=A0A967C8U4_9PROT|nr:glycerol-3-phosphate dehydrogenase [Pelagibius litoralis]NIA68862.1 glycerol-3-phosphate dehydrogenase [Pelagibius litoralis]
MTEAIDILVVGGGINGAGIARDAAGRGLSVLLCEKNDLASATSSASTKLIHGGLRYLEYYEFRLVREALIEREVLLRSAPHIIWPLRFVLPHNKGLRPAWLIRLGLFLYDHLGGRKLLPGSKGVNLHSHPAGAPLVPELRKGFVYSDCWVQDSRLVALNALDAREHGAEVLTRVECVSARRQDDRWHVVLRDLRNGEKRELTARALVNAAGPWTAEFIEQRAGLNKAQSLRLVKGSHIVVPKMFDHDYPYIFQNPDGRIIFAIPYEQDYTLIGTTDVDFTDDPSKVEISQEETEYLCSAVNVYFTRKVAPEDVAWSYSGVRPLYDDAASNASSATRDYVLELDHGPGRAPLLSIFGGKITTFRKLSEHAMVKLAEAMGPLGEPWTADAALPGGNIADADFDGYLKRFKQERPWLPAELAWRYARNYGTRAEQIVAGAASLADLGEDFGDGLYAAEIDYLRAHEWVETAEDFLWRRSKMGLHVTDQTKQKLQAWMERQAAAAPRQESA